MKLFSLLPALILAAAPVVAAPLVEVDGLLGNAPPVPTFISAMPSAIVGAPGDLLIAIGAEGGELPVAPLNVDVDARK